MTPRNAMIERSKKTHPVLRRRTNPTLRRRTYASTEGNAGKYAKEGRSTNGHARKSKWPEGGRHNDEPFRSGGPNEDTHSRPTRGGGDKKKPKTLLSGSTELGVLPMLDTRPDLDCSC